MKEEQIMYEVIVLGATFAAAGIAEQCKHNCLILERRAQAGYEFFGALQFDVDCESDLCESKGIAAAVFAKNRCLRSQQFDLSVFTEKRCIVRR